MLCNMRIMQYDRMHFEIVYCTIKSDVLKQEEGDKKKKNTDPVIWEDNHHHRDTLLFTILSTFVMSWITMTTAEFAMLMNSRHCSGRIYTIRKTMKCAMDEGYGR